MKTDGSIYDQMNQEIEAATLVAESISNWEETVRGYRQYSFESFSSDGSVSLNWVAEEDSGEWGITGNSLVPKEMIDTYMKNGQDYLDFLKENKNSVMGENWLDIRRDGDENTLSSLRELKQENIKNTGLALSREYENQSIKAQIDSAISDPAYSAGTGKAKLINDLTQNGALDNMPVFHMENARNMFGNAQDVSLNSDNPQEIFGDGSGQAPALNQSMNSN